MRKPFLLVLLLIIQNSTFSQDCDSLLKKVKGYVNKSDSILKTAQLFQQSCLNSEYLNKKELSTSYYDIAVFLTKKGSLKNAIAILEKGLEIDEQNGDTVNEKYPICLDELANDYANNDDYQNSLKYFKKALDAFELQKKDSTVNYCLSCSSISVVQQALGNFTDAIGYAEKSFNIFKTKFGKRINGYYTILTNLTTIYYVVGKYSSSLKILIQEDVEHDISSDITLLSCRNNLAATYLILGNYEKAIALHNKNLIARRSSDVKDSLNIANTLNNISTAYEAANEFDKAESSLLECISIRKKKLAANNLTLVRAESNLAQLYANSKKEKEAIRIYNDIIRRFDSIPNLSKGFKALVYNNLGMAYDNIKNFDSASYYLVLSIDQTKEYFGNNYNSYFERLNSYAGVQIERNLLDSAKKLMEMTDILTKQFFFKTIDYIAESDRLIFVKKNYGFLNPYSSLNYIKPDAKTSNSLFQSLLFVKGILLNESIEFTKSIKNSTDSLQIVLFQKLNNKRKTIGLEYSKSLANRSKQLVEIEAEAQDIEQQLALRSADFRRYEQRINITSNDIQGALKPNEAAIEFTSFKYYNKNGWTDSILYAAIILTKNSPNPKWVYLFEEKQLKNLLFTTNANFLYSNQKIPGLSTYGTKLYNLIIQKIEPYLKGISTVYYSPSGILNQVSFAAIPLPGSNKALCNKYNLVQMSSTKNIVLKEPEISISRIALMGGIQYSIDSTAFAAGTTDTATNNTNIYTTTILRNANAATKSFPYLKGTLKEVSSIDSTASVAGIRTNVYTNNTATEEVFKSLSGQSPSVLHIATHGFYLPYKKQTREDDLSQTNFSLIEDPMFRSGIALAGANLKWNKNIDVPSREDGIVTAYEIAQMDLSKTELVVLSACESGLGDIDGNEGVFGLQRGFKSAGVNKMILTLWQVPDKAATQFMSLFYKKWLSEKKDIHSAFTQTQLAMQKLYINEPAKWAGFVLIE